MRTAHLTFNQPTFNAVVTALARCFQKGIFDWGFKKVWIMAFFGFLLNLKFQWKLYSLSCMRKNIRFSKVRKPFRVLIFGLLQKTKNCLTKKPLKLSVYHEPISDIEWNITIPDICQSALIKEISTNPLQIV